MRVGAIFIPFIPNVVNPIVSLPFGDVFSFDHPFNSYPLMVMLRRDRFYHRVYTCLYHIKRRFRHLHRVTGLEESEVSSSTEE